MKNKQQIHHLGEVFLALSPFYFLSSSKNIVYQIIRPSEILSIPQKYHMWTRQRRAPPVVAPNFPNNMVRAVVDMLRAKKPISPLAQ